jgi:flagellin-like protein
MSIIPRMNKKGVSPIIATLLLIVIAVAAAVVTYAFVTGFIGTSSGSATQQGSMSFDSYAISGNATCTVYLRNTGTKALTVSAAYIDGTLMSFTGTAALPVGGTTSIVVTSTIDIGTGASHQLRVICTDGTPLQISIVKGA